eukprot:10396799-Ditylum_brightwellii.AAC.1
MMPKFTLQRRVRKYGNGIRRVESPVIVIKCAAKEAPYLKTLLTYKRILRDQNSSIALVAAVVINCLTEEAVHQKVNY